MFFYHNYLQPAAGLKLNFCFHNQLKLYDVRAANTETEIFLEASHRRFLLCFCLVSQLCSREFVLLLSRYNNNIEQFDELSSSRQKSSCQLNQKFFISRKCQWNIWSFSRVCHLEIFTRFSLHCFRLSHVCLHLMFSSSFPGNTVGNFTVISKAKCPEHRRNFCLLQM